MSPATLTRKSKSISARAVTICGAPQYRLGSHTELPHIVKFSGGRSSAAMTISLARSDALNAERGDAVLFANTTAEHPATYEFAAKVCDEIEQNHGIPCFWYEFCTVEAAARTGWTRVMSYRLVRRVKSEPNDNPTAPGFSDDGSAFEELASLKGMLPNRSVRICTQHLKILPGLSLIAHWLGGGPGPPHAGHYHGRSLVSAQDAAFRYNGERLDVESYAVVRAFAYSRPWARPAQSWADFIATSVKRPVSGPRYVADIAGRTGPAVSFVTLLGLRADEPGRVKRAHFESMLADGALGVRCRHESHPAGEIIATPLADAGITQEDVNKFWRGQSYDLGISGAEGNCVYCFMKGEPALRRLASAEQSDGDEVTGPAGIGWWADIESRYAGVSDDAGYGRFKFLALKSPTYAEIASDSNNGHHVKSGSTNLPCACTD